jgi:serine/threonine protein kinase
VLARLQHPNICLIYDAVFDEERHQFYLVMEYVPGQSLADLMEAARSPLPLELTLEISIDVLQALDYAHRQGVVHRDIKPDNVIIHQGTAKLTDFGLASLISVLAGGTNLLAGTPEYLAPEQAQGLAVDGRADLYGLGIMLFEMATGSHLPFEQYVTMSEILLAQVNEDPPSPRVFASGVPLSLEYIIMRLLAKAPDDRYPSAAALLPTFETLRGRQRLNQSGLVLLDIDTRPFVGRKDELRQMKALWKQVRQLNRPHLLILSGEPRIGKTTTAQPMEVKTRLKAEEIGLYLPQVYQSI